MILENLEVKHKTFGEGLVISNNGKYMTVKFGTAQKTFVYPDAFESFLTLSDGSVSDEILADIKLAKDAKQQILNKKNEENLRAMTMGIVIPGKENNPAESEDGENRFKAQESEEI
jgi:hypothetical protein